MVCWCVRTRVWKQTNKQTKKHFFNFLGRPFVMVSFAGCSGTGDCLRQEHVMKCVQIHGAECKICYFVCVRCVLMKNFISHTSFFFLVFFFWKVCFSLPSSNGAWWLHNISKVQNSFFVRKVFLQVLSWWWWWCCSDMMSQLLYLIFWYIDTTHLFSWCFPPAPHHRRVMEEMRKKIPDTWIDLGMDKGLVLMYYFLYCGSGQCLVGLLQGLVFFPYKSSTGYKTSRVHSMGKMVGTLAGCLGRALS